MIQNADDDLKDEMLFDYVDGETQDEEDKLEHFEGALADQKMAQHIGGNEFWYRILLEMKLHKK